MRDKQYGAPKSRWLPQTEVTFTRATRRTFTLCHMNEPDPCSGLSQQCSDGDSSCPTALQWFRWAVLCSVVHGLLTWWSVTNISRSDWIMEEGERTLIESVAVALAIVLNFPTMIVCRLFQLPPLGCFTPPFLIANSCLWGMALALLFTRMTNRRNKNAGQSNCKRQGRNGDAQSLERTTGSRLRL